jgi:proteasome beta subunit
VKDTLNTGTTTLAIKYADGVIVGADKRVTAGHMIADTDVEKIIQIAPNVAVTIAGVVSDAQLFSRYIRGEIRLLKLRIHRDPTVKEIAQLLGSYLYSSMRQYFPSIVHFIVSGFDKEGSSIYDVSPDGAILHKRIHTTSGSGSGYVMGILELDYKDNMSEDEARGLVKKCLRAAMLKDAASGNGADIYRITKEGVQKMETLTVDTGIAL